MSVRRLVVNFLGGPGCGKSTAASGLFSALKKTSINVEFAAEFARELVIEKNTMAMSYQPYVWATQCYRIFSAYQTAQIVVTDSPILLGSVYANPKTSAFLQYVLQEHQRFDNFNILMPRDMTHPYSMTGRIHTLEQSITVDTELRDIMNVNNIPFFNYEDFFEEEFVDLILSYINER